MINEQNSQYVPRFQGHMFPLFKFMQQEHANQMLSNGEIYIPNLYSFSNNDHYSGLSYDSEEPQISVVDIENRNKLTHKKLPDGLVYCTSGLLFSDSLSWAIEDGKETCVMITDSNKFIDLIQEKINKNKYDIRGFCSCFYMGIFTWENFS